VIKLIRPIHILDHMVNHMVNHMVYPLNICLESIYIDQV